jgi:hypothetical protein
MAFIAEIVYCAVRAKFDCYGENVCENEITLHKKRGHTRVSFTVNLRRAGVPKHVARPFNILYMDIETVYVV